MDDLLTREDLKLIYKLIVDYPQPLVEDLVPAIDIAEKIRKFMDKLSKKQQDSKLRWNNCEPCRDIFMVTVDEGNYLFNIDQYRMSYSQCPKCKKMYYHMENKAESPSLLEQLRTKDDLSDYNNPEQIRFHCMGDDNEERK